MTSEGSEGTERRKECKEHVDAEEFRQQMRELIEEVKEQVNREEVGVESSDANEEREAESKRESIDIDEESRGDGEFRKEMHELIAEVKEVIEKEESEDSAEFREQMRELIDEVERKLEGDEELADSAEDRLDAFEEDILESFEKYGIDGDEVRERWRERFVEDVEEELEKDSASDEPDESTNTSDDAADSEMNKTTESCSYSESGDGTVQVLKTEGNSEATESVDASEEHKAEMEPQSESDSSVESETNRAVEASKQKEDMESPKADEQPEKQIVRETESENSAPHESKRNSKESIPETSEDVRARQQTSEMVSESSEEKAEAAERKEAQAESMESHIARAECEELAEEEVENTQTEGHLNESDEEEGEIIQDSGSESMQEWTEDGEREELADSEHLEEPDSTQSTLESCQEVLEENISPDAEELDEDEEVDERMVSDDERPTRMLDSPYPNVYADETGFFAETEEQRWRRRLVELYNELPEEMKQLYREHVKAILESEEGLEKLLETFPELGDQEEFEEKYEDAVKYVKFRQKIRELELLGTLDETTIEELALEPDLDQETAEKWLNDDYYSFPKLIQQVWHQEIERRWGNVLRAIANRDMPYDMSEVNEILKRFPELKRKRRFKWHHDEVKIWTEVMAAKRKGKIATLIIQGKERFKVDEVKELAKGLNLTVDKAVRWLREESRPRLVDLLTGKRQELRLKRKESVQHAATLLRVRTEEAMNEARWRHPEAMRLLDDMSFVKQMQLLTGLEKTIGRREVQSLSEKMRAAKASIFWMKIITEGRVDTSFLIQISSIVDSWQRDLFAYLERTQASYSSYLDYVMQMLDGAIQAYLDRIINYAEEASIKSEIQSWLPARNMRYLAASFLLRTAGSMYNAMTDCRCKSVRHGLHSVRDAYLAGGHEKATENLEQHQFRELSSAIQAVRTDMSLGKITSMKKGAFSPLHADTSLEDVADLAIKFSRHLGDNLLTQGLQEPNPSWISFDPRVIISETGPNLNESDLKEMKERWVADVCPLLDRALAVSGDNTCTWFILIALGAHPGIWVANSTGVTDVISNEPGAGKNRGAYRPYADAKVLNRPLLLEIRYKEGHGQLTNCRWMHSEQWDQFKWTVTRSHGRMGETTAPLSAQNAWHYLLARYWGADSTARQIHCRFPLHKDKELNGKHLAMAQRMALWLEPGVRMRAKKIKQGRLPSLTPSIRALITHDGRINSRIQQRLVKGGYGWQALTESEYSLDTDQGRVYWEHIDSPMFCDFIHWGNKWDFSTLWRGLLGAWIVLGNISRNESMVSWTLEKVADGIDRITGVPLAPYRVSSDCNISKLGWQKPYTEYCGFINLDTVPNDVKGRMIHSIICCWMFEIAHIASRLAAEVPTWNLHERIAEVLPSSGLRNLSPKSKLDNMVGLFLELKDRLEDLGFVENVKAAKGTKKGLGGEKIAAGHEFVGTRRSCTVVLDEEEVECSLYETLSDTRGSAGCPFTPITIKMRGLDAPFRYPLAIEVYLGSRKRNVVIPNPDLWWDVETLGLPSSDVQEIAKLRAAEQWERLAMKILSAVSQHYGDQPGWEVVAFQQGRPERFARLFLFYQLLAKEAPLTIWGSNVAKTGVAATANTAFIPFSYEHSLGYLGQLFSGLSESFLEENLASNLHIEVDSGAGQKIRYLIASVQHNTLKKDQCLGTAEDARILVWVEKADGKVVEGSRRALFVQWRVKQARTQQKAESLVREAMKSEKHPKDYSVLYMLDLYRGASGTRLEVLQPGEFHFRIARASGWMNLDVPLDVHETTSVRWLKEGLERRFPGALSIAEKISLNPADSSLVKAVVGIDRLADVCPGVFNGLSSFQEAISSNTDSFSNITRIESKLRRAERLAGNMGELKQYLDLIAQIMADSSETSRDSSFAAKA